MRALACLLAGVVAAGAPAWAQDTAAVRPSADAPCYRARPRQSCAVFFLTNFGGYVTTAGTNGGTPLRGVADWGVMVNVSEHDAVGASFFALLDDDGIVAGPVVRYRRWLAPPASLDIGVGTPLVASDQLRTGSVYGLVKWNPVHWFGVGVRPELVRRNVFLGCGTTTCTYDVRSQARLSIGTEFGWVPGLALTGAAGAAVLVLVAAFAYD